MTARSIIFVLILCLIHQADLRDLCTKNAILKRSEEIYISKESKHEIEFDFTDFIVTMDKIKKAKDPFVTEIAEYSSLEILKAKSKLKLIPFNNRVNLIPTNGTAANIIEHCKKINAPVFSFESKNEVGQMKELMVQLGLTKIGFYPMITPQEIIGKEGQKFLWATPSNVTGAVVKEAKLVMFSDKGDIAIDTTETVIDSFCSKAASPFDSLTFDEFEGRTWVKLVDQSLKKLKVFEKLYNEFKDNLDTIKVEEFEPSGVKSKTVTWTVPSEVLRAHEFVTSHDYDLTWEDSTGEVLYELSQFVEDMTIINDYISDRLRFDGRKLVIYPRFETEGLDGMNMRQITLMSKFSTRQNGVKTLILKGEALGKSIHAAHKVTLYKGYAHGYGLLRPADSLVVADGPNYRAVSTFDELGWECSTDKAKKICAETQQRNEESQAKCGEYFFGKTGDHKSCPLVKVDRPLVYGGLCGNENEILSSFYQDYRLSLWCDGYLTENLDLTPGLSVVQTRCEVRSEDGQTIYSHQVGNVADKKSVITKLGTNIDNEILRRIEDVLGWPATGALIIGGVFLIGLIVTVIVKRVGLEKCRSYFIRNRRNQRHGGLRGVEIQEMQALNARHEPSIHVYNFNAGQRGPPIVPRRLALNRS